jgi:signal transduction histidine kinase
VGSHESSRNSAHAPSRKHSEAHAAFSTWRSGIRLEALGNFAHELRTPIQVLLGYIDILREEWAPAMPSEAREMVERMDVQIHDLARTLDNAIEFVIAETNAEPVDEDVAVKSLMAEITPYIDAANQKKALAIRFDLAQAPEVIRAPRRILRSTLLNLILNAIKFTESGAVNIAIRRATNRDGGAAVEFEVSDTGPGLNPALLNRATQPFSQLSRSSVRRYRGLGLGLALVRRNLEAVNGTFTLREALPHGTDVIVTIPSRTPAKPRHSARRVIPMPHAAEPSLAKEPRLTSSARRIAHL